MFLSALQPYVVIIIIAVVLLQYAFAVFCLLKLAYLNLTKQRYIMWNLFILIVFFIGGAVFLVYYKKHPELKINLDVPPQNAQSTQGEDKIENAEPQNAQSDSDADSADNGGQEQNTQND